MNHDDAMTLRVMLLVESESAVFNDRNESEAEIIELKGFEAITELKEAA